MDAAEYSNHGLLDEYRRIQARSVTLSEFSSRTSIRQLLGLDSLLFCHPYLSFFLGSLVALAVLKKVEF